MLVRLRGTLAVAATAALALPAAVLAAGAAHAEHAQGRTLTIGSNVAPPSLDATSSAAAAIREVFGYNVYQHLVQLTPEGTLVPVLATGWKVSKDGRVYTFDIRKGVRFSNGDPMTPADVVFSLKRVVAPDSKYPYKDLMADLKSVKQVGANRVQVTLKNRNWEWLYDLASNSNGFVLDPDTIDQIATKPVGTGPYMFKSFRPNYSVELVRNPYYWGAKTNVDAVTFRYFATANSEESALESGQIDVIDNALNPLDVGKFKGNSKYKIIAGPTYGKIQLTINNSVGPLKNELVRQAITHAIDKKAIIKNAGGYGVPLSSGTVPGDPWYLDLSHLYPYDPAKAKQLLAKAGYPNGFSLTLKLPPYTYATQAGTLVAAELNAVGIKTTIKNIQWPLWLSQVFTNASYDLTIVDHVTPRDIAHFGDPEYYWRYADAKAVQKLLSAGDQASSKAQWVAKYKQVVRKIAKDAVNVWLYDPDQITIAHKNVNGLPLTGRTVPFSLEYASFGGKTSAQGKARGYGG